MEVFHSTKISKNSGSKSNGTENFRKLISRIAVNFCPFFQIFGNSGNFLFHLTFLPGMNRPQFLDLVVPKSSNHTGCRTICHSLSLLLIRLIQEKFASLSSHKNNS